jgi:hypothetical protein
MPYTAPDGSANQPVLAANLLSTFPVNNSRLSFYIQNQSADTLQVVIDDGNGGPVTIVLVDPGAGANKQGGDWSPPIGWRLTGRIRIYGPNSTDQFAAREY